MTNKLSNTDFAANELRALVDKLIAENEGLRKENLLLSEITRASFVKHNYGTSIGVLGLSSRAYNCLYRNGIFLVENLVKMSTKEVLSMQNLGPKVFKEINESVKQYGRKKNIDLSGWE